MHLLSLPYFVTGTTGSLQYLFAHFVRELRLIRGRPGRGRCVGSILWPGMRSVALSSRRVQRNMIPPSHHKGYNGNLSNGSQLTN